MLALCLESIDLSKQPKNLDVRIFLDVCDDERLEEVNFVRDTYFPQAEIFRLTERPEAPSGCYNILHSLREGFRTGANFIHLIEEDVRITPLYFQLHMEKHLEDDYFVTCGRWRRQYTRDYYTNPGSCFRRSSLAQIVPHINDSYFKDRRGYLDRFFHKMDEASDLDDGLIRRVIRASGSRIYNFEEPTCAHQGFRFYGAKDEWRTTGNIEERIKQLRKLVNRRLDLEDPRYLNDFEHYDVQS